MGTEDDEVHPVQYRSCGHQFEAVPSRLDTGCPRCNSDSLIRVKTSPLGTTAPVDATRDALAEDLWDAQCRDPKPHWRRIAAALLTAGYLPPDQADALRAEVAEAKARVKQQANDVEASDQDRRDVSAWLLRESEQRTRYFPQRVDGVDRLMRHLARAVLAPGAADAHDRRVRAEGAAALVEAEARGRRMEAMLRAVGFSQDFIDGTETEETRRYESLIESGLSDHEARETVWPRDETTGDPR